MDSRICSGQTDTHIEYRHLATHTGDSRPIGLHKDTWVAFDQLREAASSQGIDLKIASGYRDFDRQLSIWNGKASGARPIVDDHGQHLDFQNLPTAQLVNRILRWSALPGASRHHWGSDLDVYDAAAISQDYVLELTPAEYAVGGPFEVLNQWLTQLEKDEESSFGFFRPYSEDRGGIAPEAWHLSYAPLASMCQQSWLIDSLRECVLGADIELKEEVVAELDSIYERYVRVSPELYPSSWRGGLA